MKTSLRLVLFLLLAACVPALPAADATPTSLPVQPSAAASPTSTPVPTADPTQTPSPAPTQPPLPSPTAAPIPALCSPLGGYDLAELPAIVSQPFIAPHPGKDDGHHGTDFAHYAYGGRTTIAGAPVQAAFAGRIAARILDSWPYGNVVILESTADALPAAVRASAGLTAGQSLYHLYAHLDEITDLEAGAPVDCGAALGTVGNTGWSGNYHLHFELRVGPAAVQFQAMSYYLTTTTAEERASYERWRFLGEFFPLDPLSVLLP